MTSIIVLSDSDESVTAVGVDGCDPNRLKINEIYNSDAKSDFNFPEVQFFYTDDRENLAFQGEGRAINSNTNNDREYIYKTSHTMSDSSDSKEEIERFSQKVAVCKKNKNTLREERLKRQQILAKEKALKAVASKKLKDMKPGECMKFMEVNVDEGIEKFTFHTEIKSVLQDANIKFNVTTELIPNSITWKRNVEENYIDENNTVRVRSSVQKEQQAIVIWNNYEAVKHVTEGTFCSVILNSKALIPHCTVTLVIFGMEEYFAYWKKTKSKSDQHSDKRKIKSLNKNNSQFEEFPAISRKQLEMCLTELQIIAKCSSRLVDSAQDVALMVYQYTKSISEIPYKLQKKESLENKFDWYVMEHNKNTVRIDKDGNGLKRLWQQQLCQFNLSSLETAEAICTVYPSPAQLIKAYKNCTYDEGANLLKDIPIRRAVGPLTAVRKVGPELSKKIYVMFTSQNGDALLGTEESKL